MTKIICFFTFAGVWLFSSCHNSTPEIIDDAETEASHRDLLFDESLEDQCGEEGQLFRYTNIYEHNRMLDIVPALLSEVSCSPTWIFLELSNDSIYQQIEFSDSFRVVIRPGAIGMVNYRCEGDAGKCASQLKIYIAS